MNSFESLDSPSVINFVTGSNGFIGSSLKNSLMTSGSHVIEVGKLEPLEFEQFVGRQMISESIKKRLILCDWQGVYGSRDDLALQSLNSSRLIEYSKVAVTHGFEKILALGSQAEVSANQAGITPDAPFQPRNSYGRAKEIAFLGIKDCVSGSNTALAWARLFSVYGPTMSRMTLISRIIEFSLERLPIELSEGKQQWNYLYVTDCANALIKILENATKSKVFNVASSSTHSIRWVANFLASRLDSQELLKFGAVPYATDEVFDMSPNIASVLELGWEEFVSIEEGLVRCIESYRAVL